MRAKEYVSGRSTNRSAELVKHLFVLMMLAFAFFPLYMMLNISTKTNKEFYRHPWYPTGAAGATFQTTVHNYVRGWETIGVTVPNTVFLAVTTTGLTLAVAICSAYVFARYKFFGKNLLWSALMLLMLMPPVANLVPLFTLLREMSLLNTYTALILMGSGGAQAFNVFILRNYIEDTPEQLFEATEVDGGGMLRQIWNIVIPMNGSIIATLACLGFVRVWNNFLLPLLIIRDPERLPTAVALFRLEGSYFKQWGPTMAAYTIAALPLIVLFVFTMRFFVRGIAAGSVKG